ncbi:hypothetical protein PG993_002571 [Apiospora rasikravindrae]|uniref:Protein kinase domain-containing protein n=1 Tax=Apiospora rasikravindrae TaxID=990691 RepID=A0ABR1TZ78_9PEZI
MNPPRGKPGPGLKPDNPFPIYVAKNGAIGRDGDETKQPYISSSALRDYWDIDVIDACVQSVHQHIVHTERIQKYYLRVLSTLVVTNSVGYIEYFTLNGLDDTKLPLVDQPSTLAVSSIPSHWWNTFYEAQWQFCPVEFSLEKGLPTNALNRRQIWPIKDVESLRGGQDETVSASKVTIDRNCIQLMGQASTCVFKEYTEKGYSSYKNEVEAYTNLARHGSQAIIRCYDWFEQAGKYTIILEYAELGSLLDYWESTHEPTQQKDIDTLWTCFFELLRGLAVIHNNLPRTRELEGTRMFGMHSDIKPGNILVSKKACSSSPYDVLFKIADFGLSRTRPVIAGSPDPIDIDSGGSRMYTPPEICRRAEWADSFDFQVGQHLDIWGMGCVFSEMASWVVGGQSERRRYCLLRKGKTPKELEDAGYSACFHDGEAPLPLVKEYHDTTLRPSYRIGDSRSFQIGQMVFKHMLLKDPLSRLNAQQLYARAENLDEEYQPLDVAHEIKLPRPDSHTYTGLSINANHSRGSSREIRDRYSFSPLQSSPLADNGTPLTPMSDRSNYQGPISSSSPALPKRPYLSNLPEPLQSPHQSLALDPIYSSPGPLQNYTTPTKIPQRQPSQRLMKATETQYPEHYFQNTPGTNHQPPERANTISSRPVYGQHGFDTFRENSTTDYHNDTVAVQRHMTNPTRPGPQAMGSSQAYSNHRTDTHRTDDFRAKKLNHQRTELQKDIDYTTILTWYSEKRNVFSSVFGSSKPDSMNAEWRRRLESAKSQLGKRDLVFIIDDSVAMREHWERVVSMFKALYFLVKPLDDDGVDVYFTSEPNKKFNKRWETTEKYFERIEKRRLRFELCPMEKCLSERFLEISQAIDQDGKSARRTSLFVLSNGHWAQNDADKACGVAILIRNMVDKLVGSTMDRFQLSLQFVRFNTDDIGTPRLAYLDDDITEEFQLA